MTSINLEKTSQDSRASFQSKDRGELRRGVLGAEPETQPTPQQVRR